jgi:hypothetical protein
MGNAHAGKKSCGVATTSPLAAMDGGIDYATAMLCG